MKKLCLLIILLCLILTGCGAKAKDNQAIIEDIMSSQILPIDSSTQITDLEIIQRQTTKSEKTDWVFVQVNGHVQQVEFTAQYELSYEYFDQGGWILQNIQPYQQEVWTIQCPEQDRLAEDLTRMLYMDLPGVTVENVQLIGATHTSDLLECHVSADVEVSNEYATGTFPVHANYILSPNGWEYLRSNVDHENAVVTPVAGVPEAYVVEAAIHQLDYWGTYEPMGSLDDFVWGSQVWYLQNHEPGEYLDLYHNVSLFYTFDVARMEWVLDDIYDDDTIYDWNLEGTWKCSGTGTDYGINNDYDYNYELTLVIEDTGNHQYQVDYSFTAPFGYKLDSNNKRYLPEYSGTFYLDAAETVYEGHSTWPGARPENQYLLEWEPDDFYAFLYIGSEDGVFLTQSGTQRYFERQ